MINEKEQLIANLKNVYKMWTLINESKILAEETEYDYVNKNIDQLLDFPEKPEKPGYYTGIYSIEQKDNEPKPIDTYSIDSPFIIYSNNDSKYKYNPISEDDKYLNDHSFVEKNRNYYKEQILKNKKNIEEIENKIEEKKIELNKTKNKFRFWLIILLCYAIGFVLAIIFPVLFSFVFNNFVVSSLLLVLWIIDFCFLGLLISKPKKIKEEIENYKSEYSDALSNYNEAIKTKDTFEYNLKKYDIELEEYKKQYKPIRLKNIQIVNDLKDKYVIYHKDALDKYAKLTDPKILSKMKDIISEEYFDHAARISFILEDGRADNLKEALNVLMQDLHNEEMLKEKMKQTLILEKDLKQRREEETKHNREMEKIAENRAREQSWNERKAQEEIERHNRELERNSRFDAEARSKQTKALALCTGCPDAGHCTHLGVWHSDCPRRR